MSTRRPRDPHKHSGKGAFYRACWQKSGESDWMYGDVRTSERAASDDMWFLASGSAGNGTVLSAQAASAAAALPLLVFNPDKHFTSLCRGAYPWQLAMQVAEHLQTLILAQEEGNKRRIRETQEAAVGALEPLHRSLFGTERQTMALACTAAEIAITFTRNNLDALDALKRGFESWAESQKTAGRAREERDALVDEIIADTAARGGSKPQPEVAFTLKELEEFSTTEDP